MPCTTILVGRKATIDGSTMIARNDDCYYDVKKLTVITPSKQPRVYKNVISHLSIELPDNPLSYTCTPNVDIYKGVWGANGINSANVAMTATETITSNALVLGADPYVNARAEKGKWISGGIGEEDLVTLVLPYITSAREGMKRAAMLLEKYGTYEPNGFAISDEKEIWWMETIGGHHYIAKRVKDEEIVLMPNRFGLDNFDFKDALGEQKEHMCSKDMLEFIKDNHLDGNNDGRMNPRLMFGSHSDSDHVYNTPRSYDLVRYFAPKRFGFNTPNPTINPENDDLPFSIVPEFKVRVEDVKYALSLHFQGTEYDPYAKPDFPKKGIYRTIGTSKTAVMAVLQIRPNMPKELAAIEWICFGSNPFNTVVPLYAHVDKIPAYFSGTTKDISTSHFYWASRLLGVICDPHFGETVQLLERYVAAVTSKGHEIINRTDKAFEDGVDLNDVNEELAEMAKKETGKVLKSTLLAASLAMKNNFNRSDN